MAVPNVECWTDHSLVKSKMIMKVKRFNRARSMKQARPRLQISILQNPEILEQIRSTVDIKLNRITPDIQGNTENYWLHLRDAIYASREQTLGTTRTNEQPDWYRDNNSNIRNILDAKHNAFQAVQNNPNDKAAQDKCKDAKLTAKIQIRTIKNTWWTTKAQEIQNFAYQHYQRNLFNAIKGVYGVTHRKKCCVKNLQGNILKDETAIRERWKEHFSTMLNLDNEADFDIIDRVLRYQTNLLMDQDITTEEVRRAINGLKKSQSVDCNGIPTEVFKSLIDADHLKTFYNLVWLECKVPQDFRDVCNSESIQK